MIYLDNAATTKTAPEVVDAMLPYFSEYQARRTIAESLGAKAEEIYFTAGGSEADNWALKAAAESYGGAGGHIITTKIEHPAILNTCHYLEERGYTVTYLDVDGEGMVNPETVEQAISSYGRSAGFWTVTY